MPSHLDDADDGWDSADDWPDDDDESADLIDCPHCGSAIYEDAEQCPRCGMYVVHEGSPLGGRPLWFVLLGLAGVIAVIAVLSGALDFAW
ncbi:MAG: zinc ribbon domain-containing protein [Planctomycetes bacterium]|nr:zinc ribbon domain-containing protein [Planctomycetota bacterium]